MDGVAVDDHGRIDRKQFQNLYFYSPVFPLPPPFDDAVLQHPLQQGIRSPVDSGERGNWSAVCGSRTAAGGWTCLEHAYACLVSRGYSAEEDELKAAS